MKLSRCRLSVSSVLPTDRLESVDLLIDFDFLGSEIGKGECASR
jgi:hypothetical protein